MDSLLFANITLLSTLALWANDGPGQGSDGLTVAFAIFLILPYLYFICVIVYRVANKVYGTFCYKGQDTGERQPLLNAVSAALISFVGSRRNSSVQLANDCDSDSDSDNEHDDDNDGLEER